MLCAESILLTEEDRKEQVKMAVYCYALAAAKVCPATAAYTYKNYQHLEETMTGTIHK